MSKKGRAKRLAVNKRAAKREPSYLYAGAIWQQALYDLHLDLSHEIQNARPDKLLFQNGRLFSSLKKRIRETGRKDANALADCYLLVINRNSRHDCFDEVRRLFWEELSALGEWQKAKLQQSDVDSVIRSHLSIFASWVEAQYSLDSWLSLNENRALYAALQNNDADEIARTAQAGLLADLPRQLIDFDFRGKTHRGAHLGASLGVGADARGAPWSELQWSNILRRAATLARKKPNDVTPMEEWVWWCYPVFRRHGWNARQVLEAACQRGFDESLLDKTTAHFSRYWIARGLRFKGGKRRDPPRLAEFVRTVTMPCLRELRGVPFFE